MRNQRGVSVLAIILVILVLTAIGYTFAAMMAAKQKSAVTGREHEWSRRPLKNSRHNLSVARFFVGTGFTSARFLHKLTDQHGRVFRQPAKLAGALVM
jgi:hypothetical protein